MDLDDGPAAALGATMAERALAWLATLDDGQRGQAMRPGPLDPRSEDAEAERQRWFYTPTDHGGLALNAQDPAQQQAAMRLVATGLTLPGYVNVTTIMGLENVLDRLEDWERDWGWPRGRDPGRYWSRVFGDPAASPAWGWRFGGHHVSLNYLIIGGRALSATPCFLGADPATTALLGDQALRPLAAVEDRARDLIRSLAPTAARRAVLTDRAPTDIVSANRSATGPGDRALPLRDPALWGGPFADPRLAELVAEFSDRAEATAGLGEADHRALSLADAPKGLPAADLDPDQVGLLRAVLDTYLGRVPEPLRPCLDDAALAGLHLAWAGDTAPGAPHYYRIQGPGLLVEYDNVQRAANHAHSVWRDPAGDFGRAMLAQAQKP